MKMTCHKITSGEDEIVIQYQKMTDEIRDIIRKLKPENRMIGRKEQLSIILDPYQVLYIETVDTTTYAYTVEDVYKIDYTLAEAEHEFVRDGYFRCSKSMVININRVSSLKSLPGNRIDTVLENGEHVIISRTYAREFRKILKGGCTNVE